MFLSDWQKKYRIALWYVIGPENLRYRLIQ